MPVGDFSFMPMFNIGRFLQPHRFIQQNIHYTKHLVRSGNNNNQVPYTTYPRPTQTQSPVYIDYSQSTTPKTETTSVSYQESREYQQPEKEETEEQPETPKVVLKPRVVVTYAGQQNAEESEPKSAELTVDPAAPVIDESEVEQLAQVPDLPQVEEEESVAKSSPPQNDDNVLPAPFSPTYAENRENPEQEEKVEQETPIDVRQPKNVPDEVANEEVDEEAVEAPKVVEDSVAPEVIQPY